MMLCRGDAYFQTLDRSPKKLLASRVWTSNCCRSQTPMVLGRSSASGTVACAAAKSISRPGLRAPQAGTARSMNAGTATSASRRRAEGETAAVRGAAATETEAGAGVGADENGWSAVFVPSTHLPSSTRFALFAAPGERVRNFTNWSVLNRRPTATANHARPKSSCRHPVVTSTPHRVSSSTTAVTRATFTTRTQPIAAAMRKQPAIGPRRVRNTRNAVHARRAKSELTPLHACSIRRRFPSTSMTFPERR